MKGRVSISLRLTFWFSAVFLLGFIVFGVLMWFDLDWSLREGRDKTITNRARRMRDLLESAQKDSPEKRTQRFHAFAEGTPEGNLILVVQRGGPRVFPPPEVTATAFPWPNHPLEAGQQFFRGCLSEPAFPCGVAALGFRWRALAHLCRRSTGRQPPLAGTVRHGLVWTIPALLLVSACCGYFLSRRALDPVDRLSASVRSITIGNLSRRLPIAHTRDELERLAETCNDMLARLETAVSQITRFTADASHELLSPIAVIRTVAEISLKNPAIDSESAEAFRAIVSLPLNRWISSIS